MTVKAKHGAGPTLQALWTSFSLLRKDTSSILTLAFLCSMSEASKWKPVLCPQHVQAHKDQLQRFPLESQILYSYGQWVPCQPLCLSKDSLGCEQSDTSQNIEEANILFLSIIQPLFTLLQVSLGKTWITTWGKGDGAVTRFSNSLFFRERLPSLSLALKSHFHHFPTLSKHQRPHVLHTALWC